MEPVRVEYELAVRHSSKYEQNLYASMMNEMMALEHETGLPWVAAFVQAIVRVGIGLARKEQQKEVRNIETLEVYLPWTWSLFAFGAAHVDADHLALSQRLASEARAAVEKSLSTDGGVQEDLELFLAGELAKTWRPVFAIMRERREALIQYKSAVHDEVMKFIVAIGHGRLAPQSVISAIIKVNQLIADLFFGKQPDKVNVSTRDVYESFCHLYQAMNEARVFMNLPLYTKNIPQEDAIGLGMDLMLDLTSTWVKTQILLSACHAELARECVPWLFESELRKVSTALTPTQLVELFWQRMDARSIELKRRATPQSAREIIDAPLRQLAECVCSDVRLVQESEHQFDDTNRVLYVLDASTRAADERKRVHVKRSKPINVISEWGALMRRETLDADDVQKAVNAIKAFPMVAVYQAACMLAEETAHDGGMEYVFFDKDREPRYRVVSIALLERFLSDLTCVAWPTESFAALKRLMCACAMYGFKRDDYVGVLTLIHANFTFPDTYLASLIKDGERVRRCATYFKQVEELMCEVVVEAADYSFRYGTRPTQYAELSKFLVSNTRRHATLALLAQATIGTDPDTWRESLKKELRKKENWMVPTTPAFKLQPRALKAWNAALDEVVLQIVTIQKQRQRKSKKR